MRFDYNTLLSLPGESEVRDAAIHRVSGEMIRVACTLPGAQWIATGYALAMTRCEVMQCAVRLQHALVIARRERSERRGNSSCLGGDDPGSLYASWSTVDRHGLRPRDDKM